MLIITDTNQPHKTYLIVIGWGGRCLRWRYHESASAISTNIEHQRYQLSVCLSEWSAAWLPDCVGATESAVNAMGCVLAPDRRQSCVCIDTFMSYRRHSLGCIRLRQSTDHAFLITMCIFYSSLLHLLNKTVKSLFNLIRLFSARTTIQSTRILVCRSSPIVISI